MIPHRRVVLSAVLLLASALPAQAWDLKVGPGLYYTQPSQAAKDAKDGDRVLIQAGTYENDTATWKAADLTIQAVGGPVRIVSRDGRVAGNKAIWVVQGDRTTIDGIHFAGARSSHHNGAGIRLEGRDLTLRNCGFSDNQMGILTGHDPEGVVVIERCHFADNGVGIKPQNRIGHNIYIGRQKRFEMRFSSSTGANVGHAVKSRAQENHIVYNHIADHREGRASYLVDLSEGGDSLLIGNVIQQGPKWENDTLISFAAEKKGKAAGTLTMAHNTLVNTADQGYFLRNYAPSAAVLVNNLLVGPGEIAEGPVEAEGTVRLPDGPAAARFADPDAFDYRLEPSSPAVDAGTETPRQLAPAYSFVFGTSRALERTTGGGAPDAGAFEAEAR
ncbi:right-handed parallel beta-helix repeat-containing protein [Caenispirillum salinarum]|uniref:right-handed parallel beta-helix repeat-containing protein n=1 Tax=Caenispirillum salinarum TaxID=859058 RepID=UPI00384C8A4F